MLSLEIKRKHLTFVEEPDPGTSTAAEVAAICYWKSCAYDSLYYGERTEKWMAKAIQIYSGLVGQGAQLHNMEYGPMHA